jgi:hypothetical protein
VRPPVALGAGLHMPVGLRDLRGWALGFTLRVGGGLPPRRFARALQVAAAARSAAWRTRAAAAAAASAAARGVRIGVPPWPAVLPPWTRNSNEPQCKPTVRRSRRPTGPGIAADQLDQDNDVCTACPRHRMHCRKLGSARSSQSHAIALHRKRTRDSAPDRHFFSCNASISCGCGRTSARRTHGEVPGSRSKSRGGECVAAAQHGTHAATLLAVAVDGSRRSDSSASLARIRCSRVCIVERLPLAQVVKSESTEAKLLVGVRLHCALLIRAQSPRRMRPQVPMQM